MKPNSTSRSLIVGVSPGLSQKATNGVQVPNKTTAEIMSSVGVAGIASRKK